MLESLLGGVDLSVAGFDSTTARAHHEAAGMHLSEDVFTALLEEAPAEKKTDVPLSTTRYAP
ncbi:hypothetical protein ACWD3Z_46790 [Streptomyces sp. NPDC002740]